MKVAIIKIANKMMTTTRQSQRLAQNGLRPLKPSLLFLSEKQFSENCFSECEVANAARRLSNKYIMR